MSSLFRRLSPSFRRNGVVLLPRVLDSNDLQRAQEAFEWSVANPTVAVQHFYPEEPGKYLQDSFNTKSWPLYRRFLQQSALIGAMVEVLATKQLWFFFEQIFMKQGAATRRTPWHQDSSYLPIEGEQFAVAWISLDPVRKEHALEFVRGSHRRTLYNGTAFDPADDTTPVFDERLMPRLPDIEGNRSAWPIISWAVSPGDVIVFHPAVLHGGAATPAGGLRRTVSLRFLGDDVSFVPRPQALGAASVGYDDDGKPKRDMSSLYAGFRPGDRYRHPDLIQLAG